MDEATPSAADSEKLRALIVDDETHPSPPATERVDLHNTKDAAANRANQKRPVGRA